MMKFKRRACNDRRLERRVLLAGIFSIRYTLYAKRSPRGFTLIETLVAILLVTVAIVAPMALTVQSLSSAIYARDQITASNLAQEGIEAVRSIRDSNILSSAEGGGANLFDGIPTTPVGDPSGKKLFTVDATVVDPTEMIADCDSTCEPLQTNGTLYSYNPKGASGYSDSAFTREMYAEVLRSDPATGLPQEIRVTSQVSWKTAAFQTRTITVTEDLYDWPQYGSGG